MEKEEITKEDLLEAIFGISHLMPEQIVLFNSNKIKQPLLSKVFSHLVECRICRKKVKILTLEDFQAGYLEEEYSNDFVLEQYQYYLETDPPPFFDEKITWREKIWRLFKYGENHFY